MKFFADESCDFTIVRALRSAGHNVVAVAETVPQAKDALVLATASQAEAILLTEDKDFGQLVYANGQASGGVMLLRYPRAARSIVASQVVELAQQRGPDLIGRFVVVEPHRVRFGPARAP